MKETFDDALVWAPRWWENALRAKGASRMTMLRWIGNAVARIRIANYRRHQIDRELADRHGQEHLDRLRAGIKDNVFGLNGH